MNGSSVYVHTSRFIATSTWAPGQANQIRISACRRRVSSTPFYEPPGDSNGICIEKPCEEPILL